MEQILDVGREFSSVEALWSTFEGVMGNQEQNQELRSSSVQTQRAGESGGRRDDGEAETDAEGKT